MYFLKVTNNDPKTNEIVKFDSYKDIPINDYEKYYIAPRDYNSSNTEIPWEQTITIKDLIENIDILLHTDNLILYHKTSLMPTIIFKTILNSKQEYRVDTVSAFSFQRIPFENFIKTKWVQFYMLSEDEWTIGHLYRNNFRESSFIDILKRKRQWIDSYIQDYERRQQEIF
jgi:hypothetical protein